MDAYLLINAIFKNLKGLNYFITNFIENGKSCQKEV